MSTLISLNEQRDLSPILKSRKKIRAKHHAPTFTTIQAPKIEEIESTIHNATVACGSIEPGNTASHDEHGHKITYGLGYIPEHRHVALLPEVEPVSVTLADDVPTLRPGQTLTSTGVLAEVWNDEVRSRGITGSLHVSNVSYTLSGNDLGSWITIDADDIIMPRLAGARHSSGNQSSWSTIDMGCGWVSIRMHGVPEVSSPFYKEENDPEWRKKIDHRLMDISPLWYDEMMDRSSGERQLYEMTFRPPKIAKGTLRDGRNCIVGNAWGGEDHYFKNCDICGRHSSKISRHAAENDSVGFVNTVNEFVDHFSRVHKSHVPDYREVMK